MIKFGIIGCGNVSQTYLYTLSKNKDAEVVALADIDLSKAKKHAEIFNIKSIYSDYKEMIDKESLDAVIIATPHFLHHDQAIACAKNSIDISLFTLPSPIPSVFSSNPYLPHKCLVVSL